ncbi:MAG: hypothetical protein J6S69_08875, partial [Proteobacteria bacterium]|nr:hypothetical protein [Pseudomonadota bacterium]
MKSTIFIFICSILGCLFASCDRTKMQTGGIIALTPSLTEAVWAVGTPENMPLVATSPYTTDARADGLLRLQAEGTLEQIVAMKPSLVLLHSSDSRKAAQLPAANIPVMTRAMDTSE